MFDNTQSLLIALRASCHVGLREAREEQAPEIMLQATAYTYEIPLLEYVFWDVVSGSISLIMLCWIHY
jgi:hypothetical protein